MRLFVVNTSKWQNETNFHIRMEYKKSLACPIKFENFSFSSDVICDPAVLIKL